MDWTGSESKSCKAIRACSSVGMIDLDLVSVAKDTLVSTGNAVELSGGLSAFVPVVDFLKLELPAIEVVVGSLVDCVCFEYTAGSPISLIYSGEALFCTYFSGDLASRKALLEELVFSLGSDVSEMLEKSI